MSEESRQIAEAVGSDRDRRAREVRLRAERRERMVRSLVSGTGAPPEEHQVGTAVAAASFADALLWELDRRRDAELAEAQR